MDLREVPQTITALSQKGQRPVQTQDGNELATSLGAFGYIECSALTQENLKHVFDEAIRCVIVNSKKSTKKKAAKCTIL